MSARGLTCTALKLAGISVAAGALIFAAAGASADEHVIKAHGISTFGDLKYPPDFEHLEYVNPYAPRGGEISIWAPGTFDSMNPYTRKGRAGALSSIFFESLLTGTADEVSGNYGLLAESLEYPEDRSWVVFNMRPEARFSDGTPVTAEDVEFTYELFLAEGLFSFRSELGKAVKAVEVETRHRIRFTFNTDESPREYPSLVGSLPIMSEAWFERTGAKLDESRMEPAVGSSPYILETVEPNRRLVYMRNPNYWGDHLPINRGRQNFERIRIEYFADSSAAFEGFKAGVYTFRSENSSKTWATGYNFDAIENGWAVKTTFDTGSPASGQSFLFNLRREKFQDVRVREAVALMFNFEWSNETLFYGLYDRINSFWENSFLAATGLPGDEELKYLEPIRDLIPESVFTEPAVMAPVSGERQLDRSNLRKASALLDEAGWTVGDDGLRQNAAGEKLQIEFIESSPAFDRVLNPFVENLKRLGIDAVYNRIDPAQMTDRERNHDFDVITSSFSLGLEPSAGGLRQRFGSEYIDGVFNDMGYANEGVDQLIDVIQEIDNSEDLKHAIRALDRILRAEKFWAPQWYRGFHTVAYYDIFDHPETIPPYSLGQLDFWWYDAQKAEALQEAGIL